MPMVWSAFGREHPDTSAVFETLARAAARRRGWRCHRLLLRRTRCAIGVQLVCGAVRMTRAVLRTMDDEEGTFGEDFGATEHRVIEMVDGMAGAAGPAGPASAA